MITREFSVGTAYTPTETDTTAEILAKNARHMFLTLDDEDGVPNTGGDFYVLDNSDMQDSFGSLVVGNVVDITWILYLDKKCILSLAKHEDGGADNPPPIPK